MNVEIHTCPYRITTIGTQEIDFAEKCANEQKSSIISTFDFKGNRMKIKQRQKHIESSNRL